MRLRVNKTAAAATTGVDCEVGTLFFVETVAEWTKVRFVMYRAEVVKEGAQLGFREGISCSDVPAGCVRLASERDAAVLDPGKSSNAAAEVTGCSYLLR